MMFTIIWGNGLFGDKKKKTNICVEKCMQPLGTVAAIIHDTITSALNVPAKSRSEIRSSMLDSVVVNVEVDGTRQELQILAINKICA
jgi:hypothetical protein